MGSEFKGSREHLIRDLARDFRAFTVNFEGAVEGFVALYRVGVVSRLQTYSGFRRVFKGPA